MHGVIFLITKFKNHCQHGHNPITIQSPKYLPSTNTLEWHLCDTILDTASPPLFLDKMPVAGAWCVWGRQCCIWQLAEQCPVCARPAHPGPVASETSHGAEVGEWCHRAAPSLTVLGSPCWKHLLALSQLTIYVLRHCAKWVFKHSYVDEKLGCLSAKNIT